MFVTRTAVYTVLRKGGTTNQFKIKYIPRRHYTQKSEELQKALEESLREAKTALPSGTDCKTLFTQEGERLKASYSNFHGHFTNPSVSAIDEWPSSFYDFDEKKQKLIKDFYAKNQALYFPIIEKYQNDLAPGLSRINAITSVMNAPVGQPIHVAITGAAGAIGYALCFRIASGGLFGPKTPVVLHLLELPQALGALKGVELELLDCAFPTLKKVVTTDSAEKAFEGVDYAILVGAQPRTAGMERGDLLLKNAQIFEVQGKALATSAKGKDTRVVVVGNPANTNALIAAHHAKNIPRENFQAMTRLDHNRGLSKVAERVKCHIDDISRFIIWGNHSATQFPDLSHTIINNQLALDIIKDDTWVKSSFIPGVQQRGAEIIKARGASSAASAASSALDAVHDWHFGTHGRWMSAAVASSGEYGVTAGLFYSFPVVFNDKRQWDIVKDLPIDQFAAEQMEATHKELLSERDGVTKFLSDNL